MPESGAPDPQLLRPSEVADQLGISAATLRRWSSRFSDLLDLADGGQESGSHRRYTEHDLEMLASVKRLLEQGWTDALRALYPDEKIFTFWDYFRQHWERDAGLRIDHLLLSPSLAPRLKDAGVDRWVRALEKPSDHAPTWIELEPGASG